MASQSRNMRDTLIRAGLDELNEQGIKNFSVRRVAAACGVSCAAPYKHFANKDEYIAAIIEYAYRLWAMRQHRIILENPSSVRRQILLICRNYIEFLIENPYLRSVLMSKDESFDSDHLSLKSRVGNTMHRLIVKYCDSVKMPDEIALIKTFAVRSIIYGAALMIDNGEMPNTPEIMDEIVNLIDREFDLPWSES